MDGQNLRRHALSWLALAVALVALPALAKSKTSSIGLIEFKLTRNGLLGRQDVQLLKCPKGATSCEYQRLVNDRIAGKARIKRAEILAPVQRVAEAGARAPGKVEVAGDSFLLQWELKNGSRRSSGNFKRTRLSEKQKILATALLNLEADLWKREAQ